MVKSGRIFSCHFDDIKDKVKLRKSNLEKHAATNFNVIKKMFTGRDLHPDLADAVANHPMS